MSSGKSAAAGAAESCVPPLERRDEGLTLKCGVVGRPAGHSLSPVLHREFARGAQVDLVYAAYELGESGDDSDDDVFADFARKFFGGGGFGLNVTLPFKGAALAFADSASGFARRVRAANTLTLREGKVFACNTDGAGLVRDITRNLCTEVSGKRVLVVGAGGAGRAAAHALGDLRPAVLVVVNRTGERAVALSREVSEHCGIAAAGGELAGFSGAFDVVVNASSAGHSGDSLELSEGVFREAALAYDLSYGAAASGFLEAARRGGAKVAADGLGMLGEQAALSFAVWTGKLPTGRGLCGLRLSRERI